MPKQGKGRVWGRVPSGYERHGGSERAWKWERYGGPTGGVGGRDGERDFGREIAEDAQKEGGGGLREKGGVEGIATMSWGGREKREKTLWPRERLGDAPKEGGRGEVRKG